MASLEEERKRELQELTKAKELLLLKEQAALKDIEMLEKRVKDQVRQLCLSLHSFKRRI
jgi:hypothetical protein